MGGVDPLLSTAYHEAGHAVALFATGRGVWATSIRAQPCSGPTGEPRNLHDAMVMLLAGDVAARVAEPGCRLPLDRERAADAINLARSGHKGASDREKEAEWLVSAAGAELNCNRYLVDLWIDFERLTERYCRTSAWRVWTKIIAERLLKHGSLFSSSFDDVPRDRLARAMHSIGESSSSPTNADRNRSMIERHAREASLKPNSFNPKESTVNLIWSTGAAVRRYSLVDGEFDEVLDMSPNAVRLGRLNAGAALLNTHDDGDLHNVLGCVVPGSARIANGIGTATVKLSSTPGDADIVAKIKDGIIRNVSVGYNVHRWAVTPATASAVMVKRAVDWEPYEISFVPAGADAGATVRSPAASNANALVRARLRRQATAMQDLDRRLDAIEGSRLQRIGMGAAAVRPSAPAPLPPSFTNSATRSEGYRLTLLAQRGR